MTEPTAITSRQIRAARALVNLSQKELAARAGLSINSLNNIEREVGSPRAESLALIARALEKEGVEFMENDGTRLRGERLEIDKIEGANILPLLYNRILKAFPTGNGEMMVIGKDNRRLHHYDMELLLAYKKFEVAAIKNNIKERALFLENDTNFLAVRNHYRWVPKELFAAAPMTIYADNVAILLWGPPTRLVIIRNAAIAETFRQQFEAIWSIAKPVPDDIYQFNARKLQALIDQHAAEQKSRRGNVRKKS